MAFNDTFYLPGDQMKTKEQQYHEIVTTAEKPIYAKNYRFPEAYKPEVEHQIQNMLDQQIIQHSQNPVKCTHMDCTEEDGRQW